MLRKNWSEMAGDGDVRSYPVPYNTVLLQRIIVRNRIKRKQLRLKINSTIFQTNRKLSTVHNPIKFKSNIVFFFFFFLSIYRTD